MPTSAHLLGLLRASLRTRQRLVVENLALRHQLSVLKRSVKRAKIQDSDRIFWILLRRTFKEWRKCLHFVQPDTVVKWHRRGFRYYWRRKSKPRRVGRPPIGWTLVYLIKRLSRENPLWGAPKISNELALLGHDVAESTIDKYRVRHRDPDRAQRWSTFIRNHMATTIACDFFTVPTVTFRNLFVFVVLHHGSRRILHVNVTANPTAEWTAQQLIESVGDEDAPEPAYVIRDHDGTYGELFQDKAVVLGLDEVVTPKASPWCNGFVERVIGTIRRECVDHIIPMGERHLLRVLREFVEFYNLARPHQSLGGNAPVPRRREETPVREVVAEPVLGGLHQRYRRAA